MRRLVAFATALLLSLAAVAQSSSIDEVLVNVKLHRDGSAVIHETWDLEYYQGTEVYLVRENLGDIAISGFKVYDENGNELHNIGSWNSDRSISQKAGQCGIIHKSSGVELCWGLGSYGHHVFQVYYTMSNVVKSLNDYDMLHMQLVSPGLSFPPKHVKVTIQAADGTPLDENNTRIWGFGFDGNASFSGGSTVYESSVPFRSASSVIALLRFEKGIFESTSVQNRDFDAVFEQARKGSDYKDEDSLDLMGLLMTIFFFAIPVGSAIAAIVKQKKLRRQMLGGLKPSEVDWCRDIPYDGDLTASNYVLTQLGEIKKPNSLASALILRMVYNGQLIVSKDAKGKVEIAFNDEKAAGIRSDAARDLYDMMVVASGSDRVLQNKEFSRWSARTSSINRLRQWTTSISSEGKSFLKNSNALSGRKYTEEGQKQNKMLIGLRKYLNDFTLMKERGTEEAALWREYIVYAALFGIADKVAKELRDIDPQKFGEVIGTDYDTFSRVVVLSDSFSRSITNAGMTTSQARTGGFGGTTSFGGGGGFSGGGFGGGVR